jgi:hypothetical protein
MATSFASEQDLIEVELDEALHPSLLTEDGKADDVVDRWEQPTAVLDEQLLALGYPVAVSIGDELPEVEDETASVPAAVEARADIAELRRNFDELDPLTRWTLCMFHGVFGHARLNQPQIARATGLSVWKVGRLCRAGMADLRERYGVTEQPAS